MICSITQLLRVFGSSQELFRTIDAASLRRKKSGELWYCVGGSGVIFNLEEDGRRYLLKCYTSKSRYCRAIYGDKLLEDELYIPSEHGGLWLDVVVDSWREGSTLTAAIEDAVAADNRDKLQLLSQRFDRLALELLSAEWAHGDITCDNIIVSDSLELHLIDFDGSFLPCFAGRRSLEIGTQAFQHPLRDEEHFDRTIDDYSLALISTALAHLAFEPSIYPDFGSRDALLYDPAEAVEGRCELLHHALRSFAQRGDLFAYAVGGLLQSRSVELPELYPLLRYKVEGLHEAAKPTSIFCRDNLWGYLNSFGREVIPPIFSEAREFSESKAAVKIGDVWHYIDEQAQVVINGSQYHNLKSFRNGIARALTDDGWVEIVDR